MKVSKPNPATKILCSIGNNTGLTLIELAFVMIAIIGTAAVGIPSIQGMVGNLDKTRVTDELIGDFSVARSLAIRHGRNATVQFNTPLPNQYTVTWNAPAETKVVDLSRFKAGVYFEPNPPGPAAVTPPPVAAVTFDPRGFCPEQGIQGDGNNIYITDPESNEVFRLEISMAGTVNMRRFRPTANDWVYK